MVQAAGLRAEDFPLLQNGSRQTAILAVFVLSQGCKSEPIATPPTVMFDKELMPTILAYPLPGGAFAIWVRTADAANVGLAQALDRSIKP